MNDLCCGLQYEVCDGHLYVDLAILIRWYFPYAYWTAQFIVYTGFFVKKFSICMLRTIGKL